MSGVTLLLFAMMFLPSEPQTILQFKDHKSAMLKFPANNFVTSLN
jgi:hypothetical protein